MPWGRPVAVVEPRRPRRGPPSITKEVAIRTSRGAGEKMKSLTEYLKFNIPSKMAFVNITPQVEEVVRRSGVAEGFVLCNSMHITASVFVNDDEAGLHHDFGVW